VIHLRKQRENCLRPAQFSHRLNELVLATRERLCESRISAMSSRPSMVHLDQAFSLELVGWSLE